MHQIVVCYVQCPHVVICVATRPVSESFTNAAVCTSSLRRQCCLTGYNRTGIYGIGFKGHTHISIYMYIYVYIYMHNFICLIHYDEDLELGALYAAHPILILKVGGSSLCCIVYRTDSHIVQE